MSAVETMDDWTTQRAPVEDREYRALCGLVAAAIPHLCWRHNGLGLLQAYLHEGTTCEQRVHIWHKSLMRPGIEESGLLHDHRFDLVSHVLVGSLAQVEYKLKPAEYGYWQLHNVVPARKALAVSGTNDGLVSALPERHAAEKRAMVVSEGYSYSFPKFQFHGTHTQTEMVVTLVEKRAQEEAQARIMAPYGRPVVHAFADPYPEWVWLPVLEEARTALLERWRS